MGLTVQIYTGIIVDCCLYLEVYFVCGRTGVEVEDASETSEFYLLILQFLYAEN